MKDDKYGKMNKEAQLATGRAPVTNFSLKNEQLKVSIGLKMQENKIIFQKM